MCSLWRRHHHDGWEQPSRTQADPGHRAAGVAQFLGPGVNGPDRGCATPIGHVTLRRQRQGVYAFCFSHGSSPIASDESADPAAGRPMPAPPRQLPSHQRSSPNPTCPGLFEPSRFLSSSVHVGATAGTSFPTVAHLEAVLHISDCRLFSASALTGITTRYNYTDTVAAMLPSSRRQKRCHYGQFWYARMLRMPSHEECPARAAPPSSH